MSVAARAAVLTGPAAREAGSSRPEPAARPVVRLVTFAALGLYGVVRWGTLFSPAPTARLFGLLGLALVLVVLGPRLSARHWALGLAVSVVAVLAMFPICGIPLAWMRHMRIALIARGIGDGLSSLPGVLLPYNGINVWTHVVILLGAAVLLMDAAVLMAFAGPNLSDVRRAGAALPLVALAVVPTTLLHPEYPYLQGLLLFGLLAAFMWGERIPRADRAPVIGLCALAGLGALVLAPKLDQHRPWVNYEAFAGGLAPANVDTFDWSQTYGPIVWPRRGRTVFDVTGKRADYWKAENLDVFDGHTWATGSVSALGAYQGVDPAQRAKWTQTLQVTIATMKIGTVIAAGAADRPQAITGPVFPGISPGTWIASNPLSPGDSYRVSVYDPNPSRGQLSRAGLGYPSATAPYRTIELPPANGYGPPLGARFPTFHSGGPVFTGPFLSDPNGASVVEASPYARAYHLAQQLAAGVSTPYAYVQHVESYLKRGFTYNETPPRSNFPLESFLFQSKLGYCQQFAGAMALLVRMGGVPARVAAGFTSGTYDPAQHEWAVSDIDAHAWVEAWFPHYGWVRFDPTPPADPALGGRSPITSSSTLGAAAEVPQVPSAPSRTTHVAVRHAAHASGGVSALLLAGLAGAVLVVAAVLGLAWQAGRPRGIDQLVAELERAMARTGHPVSEGMTLAGLERRVRGRAEAEEYIRALRLARFANDGPVPTLRQRRALRAELRSGLGLTGTARALWALPPRWAARKSGSGTGPGA